MIYLTGEGVTDRGTDTYGLYYRIYFQGDYNQYECGLKISEARTEDAGEWSCEVSETKYFISSLYFPQEASPTNKIPYNDINIFFKLESFVKGGRRGDGYKAKVRYRHF